MKKVVFSLLSMILVFGLAGCTKKNSDPVNQSQNNQAKQEESANVKGDIDTDICKAITADFVYSATGKTVVKVEPDWILPKQACRYYFTYDPNYNTNFDDARLRAGGQLIFMMVENLSVENQKKGLTVLDATFKSDPSIKMENMVTFRENGTLRDVRLIINPNRYVRIETNSGDKGITDDELINFAAKVAEKIQGNLSFEIKSNPVQMEEEKTEAVSESQQAVANNFLDNLANLKIQDALAMMDTNDNTKQMWGVNFNTIESLKVNKIEEAFKEEWTATHQSFKVELDVKVKPAGEQLGWQNGKNFRWITLEKNTSGTWMIHELANNP
jgi:hypothetical protein